MKRLVDLEPQWQGYLRPDSGEVLWFNCPTCGPSHTLCVYFKNPVDGANSFDHPTLWVREDDTDTFENLTVTPSILYPCFHGWIENGNVYDVSESPIAVIHEGKIVALSPRQTVQMCESLLAHWKPKLC